MDSEKSSTPVNADLYFLLHKYLSGGPFKKTLQAFHDELNKINVLPNRTDWTGAKHDRTIEDMEHQYPTMRPDYLLQLCCRASSSNTSINSNNITTLFSLQKHSLNGIDVDYNFKQLGEFVVRNHLLPKRNCLNSSNIVNVLRGREISGSLSRKWIVTPKLYSSFQFQRRTLGHLSAVYCLLFDHSGRYIITGADDLLVKLWSSQTGRLIATFRGASAEITDIAINPDNTLLAAGSIDKILRIWDLQTGIPIAALSGHTGMITTVNFCPSAYYHINYLISTSTDGSVAFWAYTYDTSGKVNFRPEPTTYQEKMRPGQAQMVCSSFSPGGTFLATGSADHHVRVYYMKGDEGPHRILEIEAHYDRVDSIEWAHSGLRFLSGSKDGTAIIWSFEATQWKTIYLKMSATNDSNSNKVSPSTSKKVNEEAARKLKVTMVTWDNSDSFAVTAISDHTLKIWNAKTGAHYRTLHGHTDEVYVLESHPFDNNIILSAGHDGQLFIWDIAKGETIIRFNNTIEHQGYGAIFDIKWAPDGNSLAASDSHGHLLMYGFGTGSKLFEQLPKELFFHTDYRPLVRDSNHFVLDEQTQVAPHLMPPPFLVDIDGNPYPPMLQKLVPGRECCITAQLVPSIVIRTEGTQEVIQVMEGAGAPDESARRTGLSSNNYNRRMRDTEGIRHSRGDWQSDPNIKWKKHTLMQPLSNVHLKRIEDRIEIFENLEMQEYRRQLNKRPHMITTGSINEQKMPKRKTPATRSPKKYQPTKTFVILSEEELDVESDSTDYSDWVAEEDVNVESPKRTRRRRVRYNSDSDGDGEDEEGEEEEKNDSREASEEEEKESPQPPKGPMRMKRPLSEAYRPSEWLTEVRPRKAPYFPQIGDEVVYFTQGHHLYLDAVRATKIYEINTKTLPWAKYTLRNHEFAKVIGIQYEIKPPRLCNLKLALLDDDGKLNGKNFTVKYHDMPDVLDFFVLKQHFDTAMTRNWQDADKFRCMIDDGWWIGEIITKSTASEFFPDSPFLCYEIKWDNGEQDRMSPWDIEPLDENPVLVDDPSTSIPGNTGEALPVLQEELNNILYQPKPNDWPNNNRDSVTKFILAGLSKVMELAIAEPFLVPVDLTTYPSYAYIVEYPIDLSTIKARFENHFYRRVTAAQYDIRYLAINAEKFNERHSIIVKHARILSELCLRIVKHCTTNLDVTAIYHQMVETYASSDEEVDVEIPSSNSRMLRSLPNRFWRHASDWKAEAKLLVQAIWDCEDSVPFRQPVSTAKYTDYHNIIHEPMDLSIVKDRLYNSQYETPHDLSKDMKLIFQNSRTYNTNQRSRIYVMTVRLAAMFEEHITKLISNWKMAKRRQTDDPSSVENNESNSSSNADIIVTNEVMKSVIKEALSDSSLGDTDSDDDEIPLKKLQIAVNQTNGAHKTSEDEEEDNSESSEAPETKYKSEESDSGSSHKRRKKKPKARATRQSARKRPKLSSSSDKSSSEEESEAHEEEEDSSEDDRPLSQVTGRTSTRLRNNVRKRARIESEDDNDSDDDDDKVLTSVSSRGRVRKLNPRVTALMKK